MHGPKAGRPPGRAVTTIFVFLGRAALHALFASLAQLGCPLLVADSSQTKRNLKIVCCVSCFAGLSGGQGQQSYILGGLRATYVNVKNLGSGFGT